jgi:hypothetical protein
MYTENPQTENVALYNQESKVHSFSCISLAGCYKIIVYCFSKKGDTSSQTTAHISVQQAYITNNFQLDYKSWSHVSEISRTVMINFCITKM